MNIFLIYPMFTDLAVNNTEQNAIRVAKHLSERVIGKNNNISDISISQTDVENIVKDFNLMKLKLFTQSGKITYSTSAKDIGITNTKDYFVNIVAKGNVYTKVVKKDTKSLEGQTVTADVVETYVPIIKNGAFIGAFEIYYDITKKTAALKNVLTVASIVPSVFMVIFLAMVSICLHKLNKEIAERKKAEEKLRTARHKAEAANIAKGRFLANMSHEIRTPMNAIVGFSDILAQEGLTPEQKGYTDMIQVAGHSLLQIIDDILDFSRIEAGKLKVKLADCSLKKLLDGIDSIMGPLVVKKGLQFEIIRGEKLPDIIHTDYNRVHQCLLNLVGNAVKFTNKGHVHVNVSLHQPDSETFIRFDVEDTGIGINTEQQAEIFEPFTQADNSSERLFDGVGLGLSITRQMTELLGGEFTFTSEVNKGSVFSLLIPAGNDIKLKPSSNEPETADHTDQANKQTPFSGTVLLAEDDPGCQILTKRLLEPLGFEVVIVNNGCDAVEKINTQHFDMVFMDMRMPDMDGFEVTEAVRKKGITIPIIALTAYAMVGDRERCIETGCDEYISKPIDREELDRILKKYAGKTKTVNSA